MQHAGYLDDSEKITEPAIKAFLDHRNAIIKGTVDSPFQDETSEGKQGIIINLEDRELYPDFFEKWTNILETSLKMLNLNSNIQIPFFDTMALGSALDLKSPQLSFPTLLSILATQTIIGPPASINISLLSLNVEFIKIPEFLPKVSNLIKPPIPPIPTDFIPAIPSLKFPTLSYGVPIFNLRDKQISIYTAMPEILIGVVGKFLDPKTIGGFATEGPSALFKISFDALKAGLPSIPGNFNSSHEINMEAMSRTLTKPIGITTIGVTIGSASNGITGNIGASSPDPMKLIDENGITIGDGKGTINPSIKFNGKTIENPELNFYKKVVKYGIETDVNPLHMIRVAINESQLNPRVGPNKIGATGIWQVTPKTGTEFATIDKMKVFKTYSASLQFDFFKNQVFDIILKNKVNDKYVDRSGPGISAADFYKIVYLPFSTVDLSTGRITTVQNVSPVKGTSIYNQNPGLDFNKDGQITMGDLEKVVDYILPSNVEQRLKEALNYFNKTIDEYYVLSAIQSQKYKDK